MSDVFSPNLDIKHLQPNADQPEVPVNAAIDAIDARITDPVVIAVDSGTVDVSQDIQASGYKFHLTSGSPTPLSPVTVNFAAFGIGIFIVKNDCGQTATLQISGQSETAPTLIDGDTGVFESDGSNVTKLTDLLSTNAADVSYTAAISPGLSSTDVQSALDELFILAGGNTANDAAIEFILDGGGSALTAKSYGYLEVPFDCTIYASTLLADQSGSVVVDVYKCSYAQFDAGSTHPVSGDKITASAPPTISSATKSQDLTLTGWTRSLNKGDILGFSVTGSPTSITRVTLSLKVQKI